MKLSVARKGDRVKMCQAVYEILKQCTGATVEIRPDGFDCQGEREARVAFRCPRGIEVHIDFDGDDRQNREGVWVLAWHMGSRTDAKMSHMFGNATGGSINPIHQRKSTAVYYGFENLLCRLKSVVECINSGDAYDLEAEAEAIEKYGTWQEQKERWDRYVAEQREGAAA